MGMQDEKINALYERVRLNLIQFLNKGEGIGKFYRIADDIQDFLEIGDIRHEELSDDGSLPVHLVNVAFLSCKMGYSFSISKPQIRQLTMGALLHDIGKYFISKDILDKPARLNHVEKIVVSEHAYLGYKVMSSFIDDPVVCSIIRDHHLISKNFKDMMDFRAKNDMESFLIAICSVADIVDAMLSHRAYKKPLPISMVRDDLLEKGIKEVDDFIDMVI